MTEGRKKESIWNGRKDEIIALYLSHSHSHHPSSQLSKHGTRRRKKDRKKESSIRSETQQQKFSQMSKGIPYWVRFGLFLLSQA
jgi:hypothetical protein